MRGDEEEHSASQSLMGFQGVSALGPVLGSFSENLRTMECGGLRETYGSLELSKQCRNILDIFSVSFLTFLRKV